MQSETIRRFYTDEPVTSGERIRAELERHVAEYLANGGVIHQVGSELNKNPSFNPREREARFQQYGGRGFNRGPRDLD